MHDPLHQFKIHTLLPLHLKGMDVSFTNASFFMVMAVLVIAVFLMGGTYKNTAVPRRWQAMVEMTYVFVSNMLDETAGLKGQKYFPFVFCVFMFILVGNLLGMIPYGYTFTSQIIVTFGLAMIVFIFATFIGFARHGLRYFSLFVPRETPPYMLPLIVPIEILSYLSRPVSLSIRLFANMMAGHTMLKVFAGFTVALGLFGVAPLIVNTVLTAFEILIAVLQAYVFTILTCIYFHDSIHLH